jgi:benzylsuccinate CoA-transferase BbsE subunit
MDELAAREVPYTPTPPLDMSRPGPLSGLRIIELASEEAAYAGKLLADMGAEVLLVEPPFGHHTRRFEPFVEDVKDPERSLWFWHYNTSKMGIALDLEDPEDSATFTKLVSHADVVLEAEPYGRLAGLGLDESLREHHSELIWVSVTPFGRGNSRAAEQHTDLTMFAGAGPAWSCGYDDHELAPVRAGGNQAYQTASLWAAVAAMVAVNSRTQTGRGQFVDVSMHAASNVTTENASHFWLVDQSTVQRQTGRHAVPWSTPMTITRDRDGYEVLTGFPPRTTKDLQALVDWMAALELDQVFPDIVLLNLAIEAGGIDIYTMDSDPLMAEFYRAARDALGVIASNLSAQEFFIGAQRRNMPVGPIKAPEEVMTDPHLVERGFPVSVHHDEIGRDVVYAGPPVRFNGSPARISRPAPTIDQHSSLVQSEWLTATLP